MQTHPGVALSHTHTCTHIYIHRNKHLPQTHITRIQIFPHTQTHSQAAHCEDSRGQTHPLTHSAHAHTHAHTHTHTRTHIHTHTHMHTHKHKQTHTQAHT